MKNQAFISLFFLSFLVSVNAQVKEIGNITLGKKFAIASKVLNQTNEIQVYLPKSYKDSIRQEYPVLYLLDGQRFFTNGVAIQKSLRSPIALPEMIVVGINSSQSTRRPLFGDGDKYTSFLKEDVIQFIDSSFRTNKERIIFGWEAAAYYISEMILKEKGLFSGVIVSDGGLASEETISAFNSDKEVYLYIANSKKDIYYVKSTERFNERLKKYNPKNLRWKYELFNEEVHQSLPQLSLYKGLQYYYHNYDALVFESIPAYIKAGGIPYLKSFYKERAKRFGGDGKINDSTKNSLIWLARDHDDFKYYSFFMEEFKDVLKTKRYDSAYWKHRLAQFYLKHKDYKNAIKFFELGIKKYPNSQFDERMKKGLKAANEEKN
ncbi:alpha/beta hydrolase-fold protein [Tenacibaculum retecalamus]|uniref:alpha/beta hydrolase-fold protein n=1 Tax=Tenacibaculum retecalamus TaxID=3018315 RepID=UPI0023D8F7D2|nr:alpha/beta hydrolase-fold protein [Tenacibaculum retecalamus]WBX72305.1 alpha/beta hydrolase-fold protein [Tenacibaculum retecalamus]